MSDCKHLQLDAKVHVRRAPKDDGDCDFTAKIYAVCVNCGISFHWVGLNEGYDPNGPTVGTKGFELRIPLKAGPANDLKPVDIANILQLPDSA